MGAFRILILVFFAVCMAVPDASAKGYGGLWNQQQQQPPAEKPKAAATDGDFLFYDEPWMFVRSGDDKDRVIPLKFDPTRIAVRPNDSDELLIKDFPAIAGREALRRIPHLSHGYGLKDETWRIYRLTKPHSAQPYFELLEAIRRRDDVQIVSPVVRYNGEPAIILPRVRVRFKPLHAPKGDGDYEVRQFLNQRAPMFKPSEDNRRIVEVIDGRERDFRLIEPTDRFAEPFLRAVDMLTQEPRVLSAIPEIVPVEHPLAIDGAIVDCKNRTRVIPDTLFLTVRKPFCYRVRIRYDGQRVELKTNLADLANTRTVPLLHQEDPDQFPMSRIQDVKYDPPKTAGRRKEAVLVYTLVMYDAGDHHLAIPPIGYRESGVLGAQQDLLFPAPPTPIKVVSILPRNMTDFRHPLPPDVRALIPAKRIAPAAPRVIKPVAPEVQPAPWLVRASEDATAWMLKTAVWVGAHKRIAAFRGIGWLLMAAAALLSLAVLAVLASHAADLFVRGFRAFRQWWEFWKAHRELVRLRRTPGVEWAAFTLPIRKVMKRGSCGLFDKSDDLATLLAVTKEAEVYDPSHSPEPKISGLLLRLFDPDIGYEAFMRDLDAFLRSFPRKRHMFWRYVLETARAKGASCRR